MNPARAVRTPGIFVGIDDTDIIGGPGTNHLARRIAGALPNGYAVDVILRHQLLSDPRIPYTSRNGSASLAVRVRGTNATGVPETTAFRVRETNASHREEEAEIARRLAARIREVMLEHFQPGSDPGLCVTTFVPPEVIAFGRRCQREPVRQEEARALARDHGIHLEGLGGTHDGVIGALAAVGLLAAGDDGRVVHMGGWGWPEDFAGARTVDEIRRRGVDEVVELASGRAVTDGVVEVGRRLRPAFRGGRVILFVERVRGDGRGAAGGRRGAGGAPGGGWVHGAAWRALKLD